MTSTSQSNYLFVLPALIFAACALSHGPTNDKAHQPRNKGVDGISCTRGGIRNAQLWGGLPYLRSPRYLEGPPPPYTSLGKSEMEDVIDDPRALRVIETMATRYERVDLIDIRPEECDGYIRRDDESRFTRCQNEREWELLLVEWIMANYPNVRVHAFTHATFAANVWRQTVAPDTLSVQDAAVIDNLDVLIVAPSCDTWVGREPDQQNSTTLADDLLQNLGMNSVAYILSDCFSLRWKLIELLEEKNWDISDVLTFEATALPIELHPRSRHDMPPLELDSYYFHEAIGESTPPSLLCTSPETGRCGDLRSDVGLQ